MARRQAPGHSPRVYSPAHFRDEDRARARALADAHPFATVLGAGPDGAPEIAHLPCLVEGPADGWIVRTHVARANPLARLAEAGAELTVVFTGPHAYVSPTWYEAPTAQVPTWNYAVVHATGVSRATTPAETLAILRDLAARFEGPDGWSPDAMKPGAFESIARGVVGIEIAVTALEAKSKLSQNRSPADHSRVRDALAASSDPTDRAVAALMR